MTGALGDPSIAVTKSPESSGGGGVWGGQGGRGAPIAPERRRIRREIGVPRVTWSRGGSRSDTLFYLCSAPFNDGKAVSFGCGERLRNYIYRVFKWFIRHEYADYSIRRRRYGELCVIRIGGRLE